MLTQNKNTPSQEANAHSTAESTNPTLEVSQRYNAWKAQQGSEIYINSSRRHYALILTMLRNRLTDEGILSFLSDEMGLTDAGQLLEECRKWSSAPRPEKIQSDNPRIKQSIYANLLLIWESQMNFPNSMEELFYWSPSTSFEFDYDAVLEAFINKNHEEKEEEEEEEKKGEVDNEIQTEAIRAFLDGRDEDDDDNEVSILRGILEHREKQEAEKAEKAEKEKKLKKAKESKNAISAQPLLVAPPEKSHGCAGIRLPSLHSSSGNG